MASASPTYEADNWQIYNSDYLEAGESLFRELYPYNDASASVFWLEIACMAELGLEEGTFASEPATTAALLPLLTEHFDEASAFFEQAGTPGVLRQLVARVTQDSPAIAVYETNVPFASILGLWSETHAVEFRLATRLLRGEKVQSKAGEVSFADLMEWFYSVVERERFSTSADDEMGELLMAARDVDRFDRQLIGLIEWTEDKTPDEAQRQIYDFFNCFLYAGKDNVVVKNLESVQRALDPGLNMFKKNPAAAAVKASAITTTKMKAPTLKSLGQAQQQDLEQER